jgi:hypothetical protein
VKRSYGGNQVDLFVLLLKGEYKMSASSDLSESAIFPKGQKLTNDHFTGAAWLDMLVPKDDIFNCP